jgi:hypothetical protein
VAATLAKTVAKTLAKVASKLNSVFLQTIFSDAFTRADSAVTLTAPWVALAGTWGISINQAYLAVDAGSNANVATVDFGYSDCTVSVTKTVRQSTQRLAFRFTDSANGFIVDDPGSSYDLYRRQAGAYTQIGSWVGTPASGDVLSVVLSGSSIRVYVNGVLVISATDSFNAGATKHGLGAGAIGVARFDNFSITVP